MPLSQRSAELLKTPCGLGWHSLRLLGRAAAFLNRFPATLPAHHLGRQGEDMTYWSLRQHGYTIVARNFRLPGCAGEVDLIGFEGNPPCLAFIEVKTRGRQGRFAAEDAVAPEQRRRLTRLARAFRRRRRYLGPYRFDVVAVYGADTDAPQIRLLRDAFRE